MKKLVILSERNQKILSSYLCLHLTYRNLGILICMYTGIRLGEICALTWEDISLTEGSIYIDKTIQRVQKEHNGKKTMLIIATPKTPSSIRTIPIPNQLLQIIKSSELPQKGYLLTGSTEKYIEPRTYQYHFKKLLQRCKIPETNFHALRHTFATRCVELGFDIKTLSEILGHSSINITLNRYVHPSFDLKKQNMNKMNELISFR
ncbi:MAG: site-specific integrase [Anaerobutyricum soehngenii]